MRAPDQADAGRRVEPVVRRHPVDHRDAGVDAGEGRATSPTGSAPRSGTSSPSTRATWRSCATCWTPQDRRHRPVRRRPAARGRRGPGAAADARGAGRAAAQLGSGRPARPRMALPAEGPLGDRHEDPDSGLMLSQPGPRPAAAGRDHPGPGGGTAEESQRADGVHPHRRVGPRRRRAEAAGPADPGTRPSWTVATEDRGEGDLPATRRVAGRLVGERILDSDAVGSAPGGAPAQLPPAVLRDGRRSRPGHAAEAAAVLAGAHACARADPGDGHAVRVLRRQPERAALRVARHGGAAASGRSADRHDRLRQRRHARRPGAPERTGSACSGWSRRQWSGRRAARRTRSVPCGRRWTRRTSCTGRRATAA